MVFRSTVSAVFVNDVMFCHHHSEFRNMNLKWIFKKQYLKLPIYLAVALKNEMKRLAIHLCGLFILYQFQNGRVGFRLSWRHSDGLSHTCKKEVTAIN